MRRKDITNRLKMLRHRFMLITIHWEEFEAKLGKSGLQELIDADLRILERKTALQKLLLEDQSNAENHDNEKK
ncbi:MAG: hypothetical protein R2788_12355 [Saprospiraceae bacterium]